uniref:Uncharacterized protein n=1 Tax=Salix viminalis TaxID=40686 RepID=A0A6N2M6B3_SALVM
MKETVFGIWAVFYLLRLLMLLSNSSAPFLCTSEEEKRSLCIRRRRKVSCNIANSLKNLTADLLVCAVSLCYWVSSLLDMNWGSEKQGENQEETQRF